VDTHHRVHECVADQQDIDRFLMQRYNWEWLHKFNSDLPPALGEEKNSAVSEVS